MREGPGMCCQCQCGPCGCPQAVAEPEAFRFSDVPMGQWVIGTIMIVIVVAAVTARIL